VPNGRSRLAFEKNPGAGGAQQDRVSIKESAAESITPQELEQERPQYRIESAGKVELEQHSGLS
jgi:hypothetical protein